MRQIDGSQIIDCFKDFTVRNVKKGKLIFFQGETPESAYVINSGLVRIYDINTGGEEKVITILDRGSLLPIEWIFKHSSTSLYYAEAFSDVELFAVPRLVMRQLITENNAILLDVFKRYMANNIESMLHISALEQNKASDKLLRILQWLSIGHGVEIKPGIFKINIRLTHQDLAQMTGITRETVAVEIGKLRKLKIVNYHAQHYVLDVDRMRKLAGEDELRQVKL